ncbi:hypothetical protein J3E69DRAFT_375274 [Trichoderma sp. SZMC 28015]
MSVAVEALPSQSNTADTDSELYRDIISQFPLLNAYTQLLFGFKLPNDVDRDAIVAAIQNGFDKIKEQIPWTGWQVARESKPGGILKAVPWPADVPEDRIRVKHCDDLIAPMAKLISAGVPINMLDGSILTPWPALPHPRGLEGPDPVIAMQANFVRGGLILNLSTHHTIIDGTGIYQFLNLLAIVMSGKEISADDLEQANRDRSRVISLIPLGEPLKDYSHLRKPPGYTWATPSSPLMWCYFKMPVNALARLVKSVKDDASANKPGSLMVSENDIFSAFAWQRLCAVRIANGQPPERMSKLGRAIDGRMALGVPLTYMGHMVCHALVRLSLGQVAELSLPQIAQVLRRELNQANTAWAIRSFATFMAREPDTSNLLYGGTHDPRADLMVTATGQVQPLPASWGPLGRSCFFRRPTAAPIPGCLIINDAEGAFIPLTLCMPEDDINGLKKDPLWKQYVRYVG